MVKVNKMNKKEWICYVKKINKYCSICGKKTKTEFGKDEKHTYSTQICPQHGMLGSMCYP